MRKLLFNYSFYSHPEIGKFQGVTVNILLLAFDLAGLVLVISIIITSTILFPLVPIIATLGALVKGCIISMEQYTTGFACMDFFNLYS
jgi:hypothetical protein